MQTEKGSTLVVSLILLTIITLVTVYLLEGSTLQSKMIANTLANSITYQDCRNEQEANIRTYNADRTLLVQSIGVSEDEKDDRLTESITKEYSGSISLPKSDEISINWRHLGVRQGFRGGYDLDTEGQSTPQLFEHDCIATKNLASNSQVLGAIVDVLQQAGVTD